MRLRAHAMHVYTYLDGIQDFATFAELVRTCEDLGMQEVGAQPVARVDAPYVRRLFAAPGDRGIFQALDYVSTSARLSGFLVCMVPADDQTTWRELDKRWRNAAGLAATAACVGRVRLYYALYEGTDTASSLIDAVHPALPDPAIQLGKSTELFAGCYLWEVRAADSHVRDRTFVLVAPMDREERADDWVWPRDGSALRPLPGYLWEMAKVRHEARRFNERRSLAWAHELVERAERFETAELAGGAYPEVRDRELMALQRYTALTAAGEGVLRNMERTVQVAAGNAKALLDDAGKATVRDVGLFEADSSYVTWLVAEINDEAGTAADAVRYAEPLARLASAEVQQRLRDLGERSQVLTLLETATIAAIGLVLAATQAIGYQWRTYASVKTPFVVWVLFLGLFLPLVTATRPSGPHARRWRRWVAVAGAGFVASTACLVVAWLTRRWTGSPAAPAALFTAAVVLVALVAGLTTIWPGVRRWLARRDQGLTTTEEERR